MVKRIKLINLNLDNVTSAEQVNKVSEEIIEIAEAIVIHLEEDNTEHVIEEFWDVTQAYIGLLNKLGIDAIDIMNGYKKHLEKMKNRPRIKE